MRHISRCYSPDTLINLHKITQLSCQAWTEFAVCADSSRYMRIRALRPKLREFQQAKLYWKGEQRGQNLYFLLVQLHCSDNLSGCLHIPEWHCKTSNMQNWAHSQECTKISRRSRGSMTLNGLHLHPHVQLKMAGKASNLCLILERKECLSVSLVKWSSPLKLAWLWLPLQIRQSYGEVAVDTDSPFPPSLSFVQMTSVLALSSPWQVTWSPRKGKLITLEGSGHQVICDWADHAP